MFKPSWLPNNRFASKPPKHSQEILSPPSQWWTSRIQTCCPFQHTCQPPFLSLLLIERISADHFHGLARVLSALDTHRRIDVSEDVELDHDGEEEEDAVAEEVDDAEASAESPAAEVDGANLQTHI